MLEPNNIDAPLPQAEKSLPDPEQVPVMGVEHAGSCLGLGRTAAYQAARRGDIPTLRIGRRVVVPTAQLRSMLGLPSS